ncbi:MAG: hypothetical protein ACREOM_05235 [Candidatus Dormibacteraceae bacterium]
MLRVVGIVALLVLAACDSTAVKTVPSPSPVIPAGNWSQSLTFQGDVPGQMTGIVPDTVTQQSTCTGSRTHNGETWSTTFFGTLDATGQQWEVIFLIQNFRGPGTYQNSDATIQLQTPDSAQVWRSFAADKVTFTVVRSQQAGTIDAHLTNATTGKTSAEHISGQWNCKG